MAKSLGFSCPPKVNLSLESSAAKFRKRGPKVKGKVMGDGRGSGHGFSAENPYGKRGKTDNRQFARI